MTKSRKKIITMISILVLIFCIIILILLNKKEEKKEYEYIIPEFSYDIDMENLQLLRDNADVVVVGEIVKQGETEYMGSASFTDEVGNVSTIDGTPYTNFSLDVEKVIKGGLSVGDTIKFKKHGGESQLYPNMFYLDDGGFFPEVGKKYIVFSYRQKDGSLLSVGLNTMIEYSEEKEKEVRGTGE